MERSAISKIVKQVIKSEVQEVKELPEDNQRLKQDLGVDSFSNVNIVMSIEEDFGISIADAELEDITTVGSFVDLIESKVN